MSDLDELLVRLRQGEVSDAEVRTLLGAWAGSRNCPPDELENELIVTARRAGLDESRCAGLVRLLRNERDEHSPTVVKPARNTDGGADATRVTQGQTFDSQQTRIAAPVDDTGDADAATKVISANPASTSASGVSDSEAQSAAHSGTYGVGSTIKSRFVLEELIGHGGMGSVYRARDLRREEASDKESEVAIKLINEDFQRHPDAMVALQREAKKAQALAHPNIVTVYDFDREGSTAFISMAHLRGEPLDRLISQRAAFGMPVQEATDIIGQMAQGLAYAHEKGYAHADFKPGNVFLTEQGNVRILDFGIARAIASPGVGEADNGGDHTRFDPASLGAITPAYASLEMLEGEVPQPADDVYALACIACELLTGRHPFVDDRGRKLPANEAAETGLRPPSLKGVPRRIRRTLVRGLAFRRENRFADAAAFLQAFRPPARLRRSVLMGLVLLAIVAGGSWWITYEKSDISVSMADLSPALQPAKELITYGDRYMKAGKFVQAHKAFAQAWDAGRTVPNIGPDEQSQLKVIVDRRVNKVIGHFLKKAQRQDLNSFTLGVLRLNLEFLERSGLGTRDAEIDAALAGIDQRLAVQSTATAQ